MIDESCPNKEILKKRVESTQISSFLFIISLKLQKIQVSHSLIS